MKYKALILDLDGTTVPNRQDGLPSRRVIDAIAKAKEKIHISIATGRPLYLAQPVLDSLALSGPCVITGGAQIYDPQEKKIISEVPLNRDVFRQCYNVTKHYPVKLYVNDGVTEYVYTGGSLPEKLFVVFVGATEKKIADEIAEKFQGIPSVAIHKVTAWERGKECVEVIAANGTKLHGIAFVTERLGITYDELIGVGDSYNDFPLLMACGLKVAMGNAVPELKAIADFIAPSVDEDGVATVIEKFVLAA